MHTEHTIDLVIGRVGRFVYEILGARDDAGRAEAALQAARGDEAIGEGFALKFREAFDGENIFARDFTGRYRARDHRAIIDDDRAATALARRAASVFRREDAALVAQDFEQRQAVFDFYRARLMIQRELDASRHKQLSSTVNWMLLDGVGILASLPVRRQMKYLVRGIYNGLQ